MRGAHSKAEHQVTDKPENRKLQFSLAPVTGFGS
jgi:hypothetical protein